MGIIVRIIDEKNTIVSKIGVIKTEDMENIIKIATRLDLKCLSLADYVGDTFFNEKQMIHMKKEVAILRLQPDINQLALDIIQKGIDNGLKDVFLYLKFVGE